MPPRRVSLLLWIALATTLPLPFFLVESGREPLLAILALLGLMLVWIAAEGSSGAVALAAWIIAAQVLAWGLALGAGAWLVTRVAGRRRVLVAATLAAALLVLALATPIYRTPFRADGLHATLAEVFR